MQIPSIVDDRKIVITYMHTEHETDRDQDRLTKYESVQYTLPSQPDEFPYAIRNPYPVSFYSTSLCVFPGVIAFEVPN